MTVTAHPLADQLAYRRPARFLIGDVFDRLAELPDGSVDLVVTSPPFLALRSYLPSDHPDKAKEIGSEGTPAEFIEALLRVTQELRRVLAPHGSIAVELGDTYAGSGGAGGDYTDTGLRAGQEKFDGSALQYRRSAQRNRADGGRRRQAPNTAHRVHPDGSIKTDAETRRQEPKNLERILPPNGGPGWPLTKGLCMIPESYRWALTYGLNPFTGAESPAGLWRARNIVRWVRPNPPVGFLSDKWRPGTSDLVIACTSDRRYWDDLATRRPHSPNTHPRNAQGVTSRENTIPSGQRDGNWNTLAISDEQNPAGAPLLDWWVIPPTGYTGSHYAVFPPALVEPCVKAMAPPRVCRTCGEPSRRIIERESTGQNTRTSRGMADDPRQKGAVVSSIVPEAATIHDLGWTDCGHDAWRPGLVLDPFAGSGTTLAVATGHGHDAIGIDLDERNAELALDRVGPLLLEVVT